MDFQCGHKITNVYFYGVYYINRLCLIYMFSIFNNRHIDLLIFALLHGWFYFLITTDSFLKIYSHQSINTRIRFLKLHVFVLHNKYFTKLTRKAYLCLRKFCRCRISNNNAKIYTRIFLKEKITKFHIQADKKVLYIANITWNTRRIVLVHQTSLNPTSPQRHTHTSLVSFQN